MEQTPFDGQQVSPPGGRRKASLLWLWLGLSILVLSLVGVGVNHQMQVRAEQERLASLRDQIKQVVLADNALALEVLEIDESSQITFAEFFKRTEKNKEERDALVRRLRAIEAGPYTEQAKNFVNLMEIESDFVRAEEAVSRQTMEVSSRSDAIKELETTVSSAGSDLTEARAKYLAAPYGEDYSEKSQLDFARSRLEQTETQAKETWKAYKKASDELKVKLSSASLAADDWLNAEPKMYPPFAPPRDVTPLLIRHKAKYQTNAPASGQDKTVKAGAQETSVNSAPASATTPAATQTTTPTPAPTAPSRVRSTTALDGERFPETRIRAMDYSEVEQLSDDDLRYAINEMYARYGLVFKDKALQSVFETLSWYHPSNRWKMAQIEAVFTKTERTNFRLLTQQRALRKGD